MKNNIPEVSVEQHKSLINSLSEDDYIYLYDSRFRYAIVYNSDSDLYDVCVCSTNGDWFTIDTVQKSDIMLACKACVSAVLTAFNYGKFDVDLHIIGIKRF